MINIKKIAPGIQVEMRYATPDNVIKKTMYEVSECYLCEPAAKRLAKVQQNLAKEGLGLKVWDCYRPLSVQKKLWKAFPDARYVANPKTGSRHNRGASVDLTLVDRNGAELPMPTPFDEFSPRAHRDYDRLPPNVIRNRKKLESAMEAEGFLSLPTEWWHFDDPQWKNYEIRNDPVGSPAMLTEKKSKLAASTLPSEAKQLILVLSKGWAAKTGTLSRFERGKNGWREIGEEWPVTLGSKGMAWGQGLHTPQDTRPVKREGDKTAPAGIFPVGKAYGYGNTKPAGSRWPYQQVDESWVCVDDPKSPDYNRILALTPKTKKTWSSAEKMKRKDHLYKWVVNIEQNTPHTLKGGGSCIFFHVWRQKGAPTRGCTAMSESRIVELLQWLDPKAHPHLVQLPEKVYRRLQKKWMLP